MTDTGVRKKTTARERIVQALAENPEGLSGSELHRQSGVQRGAFRRIRDSLVSVGDIELEERETKSGRTVIHRLPLGPEMLDGAP